MSPEYPYQIVTFIDSSPAIGEGVYQGGNGWYPQLTLKRRFKVDGATDETIIARVEGYFKHQSPIPVQIGTLTQTDRMPVRVLPILNSEDLIHMHRGLIAHMGGDIKSRYPERDGENYYPHITAEYGGKNVIDVNRYENRAFIMSRVCIIKDAEDGDSRVVSYIDMNGV
ncbi:TPA: hypothetical protein DD425_00120 [Candidatus Saccharibacteria bacterium]|nr:hypothetical protein [Candidatus Saccharibacteria bacterium]|tara:strand:+ start:311 stop:817 length:507 start_codon:yes stop_codon:yes gene_type:complete